MIIKLGEMLLERKLITQEQLEKAIKEQQKAGELLGNTLIRLGYLQEEQLLKILSEQLKIPIVKLQDLTVEPEAIKKVPVKFAWHYKILPIKSEGKKLTVATFNPLGTLSDVKMFLGYDITPVLAVESEIVKAIERYYGVGADTIEKIIAKTPKTSHEVEPAEKVEDIEKLADAASVIKLVNQIILEAQQKRATDIHIEPFRGKMNIRYRIDGILYNANAPADMVHLFPAIISRIKIMSKLDIVERRMPQDGRAVVKIGNEEFDLRISIIPTRHGEGVVIRILPTKMLFSLERLGLEPEDLEALENLIKRPHGIIFVTGPTGSGKTTTLYACLNKIRSSENKIITLEDPIEYELEGISQIQIMPEIGFTFAQGLRSALRHDPDIMMVGEVRDLETAELAVRIALTGHLIFSTLHTNDAAGGATRLLDMGIEQFLITSSVNAFITQRLVRVICAHCKEKDESISPELKAKIMDEIKGLGVKKTDLTFYKGKGCKECNSTGFKERTAIYEILFVNKAIKELILAKASVDKIRDEAIKQKMKTLRISGWKKVIEGVTTAAEVMRVTQVEE